MFRSITKRSLWNFQSEREHMGSFGMASAHVFEANRFLIHGGKAKYMPEILKSCPKDYRGWDSHLLLFEMMIKWKNQSRGMKPCKRSMYNILMFDSILNVKSEIHSQILRVFSCNQLTNFKMFFMQAIDKCCDIFWDWWQISQFLLVWRNSQFVSNQQNSWFFFPRQIDKIEDYFFRAINQQILQIFFQWPIEKFHNIFCHQFMNFMVSSWR